MKCKYHDLKKGLKWNSRKNRIKQHFTRECIHMYKDFSIFWTWRLKLIIFRKFFLFDILSTNWTDYSTQPYCSVDKMVNKWDFLKISNLYPIFSRNISKCCYKFTLWIWEYVHYYWKHFIWSFWYEEFRGAIVCKTGKTAVLPRFCKI